MANDPSGAGGNGDIKPKPYKVSKLMVWPSRKVNLGNFQTVDLNAGIEVVFDQPVDIDSAEVKEALKDMHKVVRNEFKEQYRPYLHKSSVTTDAN